MGTDPRHKQAPETREPRSTPTTTEQSPDGVTPLSTAERRLPAWRLRPEALLALQRHAGNRASAALVRHPPRPGRSSKGDGAADALDREEEPPVADQIDLQSPAAFGAPQPPPDDSSRGPVQRQPDEGGTAVKDPPPAPVSTKSPAAPPPPAPKDPTEGTAEGATPDEEGEGKETPGDPAANAKKGSASEATDEGHEGGAKDGDKGPEGKTLSPAEKAAQTKGPLSPKKEEEGYTALKKLEGMVPPEVAKIFEERADPKAKAHHEKVLAQAEGLRLDSMQYSYKPGGLSTALLSVVWPGSAIAEGWDRLTAGETIYSSGEGIVAGIQATIDRFRGLLKVLNEVAGYVSTVATVVAAIAALTVVGVKVAAIAFMVSVVAGLVQAAIKAFDALLGVIQILINIARARSTDDPIERARICQQMKAESGMFTDSLTGAVFDAITSVGGGAGKAAGKSLIKAGKAGLKGGAKAGMKSLFRSGKAMARLARIKAKLGLKAAAKTAGRMRNVAALKRLARIKIKAALPKGPKAWWIAKKAEYRTALRAKIAAMRPHARLKYKPGNWKQRFTSTAKEGAGAFGVGTAKDAAKKGLEKGTGHAAAVEGGGPSAPTPGEGPEIGLTYQQVAYWPSILERMGVVRGDIHKAQTRMRKEYKKAARDAGDKRTLITELKGEPSRLGTRLKMAGGKQQQLAEAGKSESKEAAEQAQKAIDKKQSAKQATEKIEDKTKEVENEADKAEGAAKGEEAKKKSSEGWELLKDAAKWAWENTFGRLFRGLAKLKKWIGKSVLKVALAAAGLDQDDMDLAGMKSDAEKDAEADEKAKRDAADSEKKGTALDAAIKKAKAGADEQEQAAMQGMVDAGDYIDALDAYDQALAQQQDHGANYIANASSSVAAVADAPLVSSAYVQPIVDGAAWLQEQSSALPDQVREAGTSALSSLTSGLESQGAPGGPAAGIGNDTISMWVEAARGVNNHVSSRATALANHASGLIGTDWFYVVDEQVAPQIDKLASDLDAFTGAAAAAFNGVLADIAATYVAAAQEPEETEPAAPAPSPPPPPEEGVGGPSPAPAPGTRPPPGPPPAEGPTEG